MAILYFLTISSRQSFNRARISDIFWPEATDSRGTSNLRHALHNLRKALESFGHPFFLVTRSSLGLDPKASFFLDASLLMNPPAGCYIFHEPERCPSCFNQIAQALEEVRGPFLDGFSVPDCEEFDQWVLGMREHLLVRVRWGLERLQRVLEEKGQYEKAIYQVERYLTMDPFDEPWHGRLMLLHASYGNRMAAELQFETLRKALKESMGVEPDQETQAILKKIRTNVFKGSPPKESIQSAFVQAISEEERRPATVLSIDLRAFGDMESHQKPMGSGSIPTRVIELIQGAGGVVMPSDGHGILGFFGVKDDPEGAARRAARAAHDIRTALLKSDCSTPSTSFRAGIHSGVIVRKASHDSVTPSCLLAKTSMALAMMTTEHSILLSDSSARLLKGQFLLEAEETILLHGVSQRAYRLSPCQQESSRSFSEAPRIFGREFEIAFFSDLLASKKGGILILEGEPGIGKSSLSRLFLSKATDQKMIVRQIECFPQYANSPFYPLVRLFRGPANLPDSLDSDSAYERLVTYVQSLRLSNESRSVALLGHFFSIPPHPSYPMPDLPPPLLRKEISALLLSVLRVRISQGPVILLLEDVHWADHSTGHFFGELLSDSSITDHVLMMITTRTGEDPPWLVKVKGASRLCLGPLNDKESRQIIHHLSDGKIDSEEEISRLIRTADGIPLFLEELTRSTIESPAGSSKIPGTLEEVLASRLGRAGDARPLLQRAAVVGRTVPIDLLRRLSPESQKETDALINRAVSLGQLTRSADPSGETLEFHHVLFQEAAQQSLPLESRRLLHQQIAETIRDHFHTHAAATPEIVAFHFERGNNPVEAIRWYEKAFRFAYSRGSYPEAERAIRSALGLLLTDSSSDNPLKLRLLTLLGYVLIERYGYGMAEIPQTFQEALTLVGDPPLASDESFYAYFGLFVSFFGGTDIRESRRLADSIVSMAEPLKNSQILIPALFADGSTAFWEGQFKQGLSSIERVRTLDTLPGPSQNSWAFVRSAAAVQSGNYHPWILWYLGRYRSAVALVDSMLMQVETSGNLLKKGHILVFAQFLFRYLRLPERALEVSDHLAESIEVLRTEGWIPSERGIRGWALVMKGEKAGLPLILKSLSLSRKSHHIAENKYLGLLAEAYLAMGEARKVREVAWSALRFSKKSGTHFFDAECYRLIGEAFAIEGRSDKAREAFQKAIVIAKSQGARALELRASIGLGRILCGEGRIGEVRTLCSSLADLFSGDESDLSLPDLRDAKELWDKVR